ncbi:MAG: hypothetical protein AW08_02045 [Candidatus Accumulibacter adjunctus]|uniref:Uncharacterized protein n=1 Tax=Candidatus Accumulibacter adjunctus TaxID=1454001 RepID=A0A011PMF6_9PROT|nr:MAG: hypothetical protein AW08_02045 [Candidatus Accumulibacter adjunctus]
MASLNMRYLISHGRSLAGTSPVIEPEQPDKAGEFLRLRLPRGVSASG